VTLRVRWLGRLPYAEAWDLQRAIHEGKVVGRTEDDYLLLVEHPHTFTNGRFADGSNLLVPRERLVDLGADYYEVDRGGDITYHGPGQLVGYPIVSLGARPDVTRHVRRLEQALIATLAEFGVAAWSEDGLTGVWTDLGKVAAIGVRVSRRVTMHGFALNVSPDLSYFGHINPCGIADRKVTSITELVGSGVTIEDAAEPVIRNLAEVLEVDDIETQLGAFARGAGKPYEIDELIAAGAFSPGGVDIPLTGRGRLPGEPDRPSWMKVRAEMGEGYRDLKRLMRDQQLNTVCEEAGCPNIYECWASGTATLMLLGEMCTRACGFCDVATGRPGEVDFDEPRRAADAVVAMGLRHAVLTSVNRDDLDDGGAAIFAETVARIRDQLPSCDIEVLIPDFKGSEHALDVVMGAKPDVLNHNTETVLRLQRDVRTAASYGRSLALLARARWRNPAGVTKSGLIVGMGETEAEVMGTLADMRAVGVDVITIGQYLRPTARHRRVDRFVHPEEFARYRDMGRRLGIPHVEAGPLVRSSYHAQSAKEAVGAG
jgi:lipoic acid synthetase